MQLNKKSISVVDIASKDRETRPVLNNVRFTREYTEACDGIRLVRVTHLPILEGLDNSFADGELPDSFLVCRDTVLELKGEKDVLVDPCHESDDDDQCHEVTFYPGLNRVDVPYWLTAQIAGAEQYPDTDTIFPTTEPQYSFFVNPHLLQGLCKLAAQFGDLMRVELRGERGLIYLETKNNEQTMKAVIVPISTPESDPPHADPGKKSYKIRKSNTAKEE